MEQENRPLVSIIVVTLDNAKLLRECLASIAAQSYRTTETIVVDNGSREDIAGLVQAEFPRATFIRLPRNTGFAAGNNRGLEAAKGDYIALINNDAAASPGWIESLVAVAEADKGVGQVASIIIDGNRPSVLDSCGMGASLDGMLKQEMHGDPVPTLTEPKEVLVGSGCACMFRMAALKEVGLFDEDFFAYCEDGDLGLRLRMAGWRAVAAPGAFVSHYYSMTLGKYSAQKIFWVERNHFWLVCKNFPLILLPLVPLVTAWRLFLMAWSFLQGGERAGGFAKHAGVGAIAGAYCRAYAGALFGVPAMFGKRFALRRLKRLGVFEAVGLLRKHRLPMRSILGIR